MLRYKRIERELHEIQRDNTETIFAYQNPKSRAHIIAVIKGPNESPYEDGYFKLDIHHPDDYPFHACQINFCTKVWHPNIWLEKGLFSTAMLYDEWSPANSLQKCLIVIQSLLYAPVVNEPAYELNSEAAVSFSEDLETFKQTARSWTKAHALVAPPTEEEVTAWFTAPPPPLSLPVPLPTKPSPIASTSLSPDRTRKSFPTLTRLPQVAPILESGLPADRFGYTLPCPPPGTFGSLFNTLPTLTSNCEELMAAQSRVARKREEADNVRRRASSIASFSSTGSLKVFTGKEKQTASAPSAVADTPCVRVVPSPLPVSSAFPAPPALPAPPSWLAVLLEGRTTAAFIAQCEEKLIRQEDFSSADLLAAVPEKEFTCDYLSHIGITARGLQMTLINLHKELRRVHAGDNPDTSYAIQTKLDIAQARIAALETENAGLKAQLADMVVGSVKFSASADDDYSFVEVDLE